MGRGTLTMRRIAKPRPAPAEKPKEKASSKKEGKGKGKEDAGGEKDAKKSEDSKKGKEENPRPKAPKKDAKQEAWRRVFEDGAPLYVLLRNDRLAFELLPLMREEFGVDAVLLSPEVVPSTLEVLRETQGRVAFTGVSRRADPDEGVILPLVEAERAGVTIGLRSGWGREPRALLSEARYAVHCGIPASRMIQVLTHDAARTLGIHDRVGRLERGMDADLLLFRGRPFMPNSRLLRVMIDGEFLPREEARP